MSANKKNRLEAHQLSAFSMTQTGVTLVELLIASVLSIAILAGMLQLMEGTKVTAKLNDSLSNIQLTGHYSLDILRNAIKYRGFEGCRRPVSMDPWQESKINWDEGAEFTNIVASGFPLENVAKSSLRGYEVSAGGGWSPAPDDDLIPLRDSVEPAPRPNSDIVSVYYASSESVNLTTDMATTSDALQVADDSLTFEQGDFVLIGDCMSSNIFSVSNAPGSSFPITIEHADTVNDSESLTNTYDIKASIRKVFIDTFYVGDTGRKTSMGDPIYALYRFRDGETTEMIEGIESLQIVYGEELSNGNIRYLSANDPGLNMRIVQSLQIGLLVYHHSSVTPDDDVKSYDVVGTQISPPSDANAAVTHLGGLYLRKIFTESVHMLNRS